jgi:hypothetical protein
MKKFSLLKTLRAAHDTHPVKSYQVGQGDDTRLCRVLGSWLAVMLQ